MPADASYVSTLRLTAASLAARCELTIDDIEDLRLAVDEACALLLPHATPGSTLDTRFVLAYARLAVEASITSVERCRTSTATVSPGPCSGHSPRRSRSAPRTAG